MLQGEYGFSNDIFINCMVLTEEKNSIISHENAHKMTVAGSVLGDLIIMLEKSSKIDQSNDWLLNFLVSRVRRMQEQIATYIEMLTILDEQGKSAYISAVQKLKYTNRLYYKYYYNLYSKVSDQLIFELNESGQIHELIDLIMRIGIISLNINIAEILDWENITEKKISEIFSDEKLRYHFNPNVRFGALTKNIFLKSLEEGLELEEIQDILDSTVKDRTLDDSIEIISKLYMNSPMYSRIMERVKKIELKEYSGIVLQNLDILSIYPMIETGYSNKQHVEFDSMLNLENESRKNLKQNFLIFHHLAGGLEDFKFCSLMSYKINTQLNVAKYSNLEEGEKLIKQTSLPIVFIQTRLIKQLYNNLDFHKNRVYVFMENSIISTLDFIEEYFSTIDFYVIKTKHFGIITFNNNKITLIQLVDKTSLDKIKKVLEELGHLEKKRYTETHEEIKATATRLFMFGMSIKNA